MRDVANLFQSSIKQWIIACPMQWNDFFFLSRVATLPCSAGGHYRTLAGASYYFLSFFYSFPGSSSLTFYEDSSFSHLLIRACRPQRLSEFGTAGGIWCR